MESFYVNLDSLTTFASRLGQRGTDATASAGPYVQTHLGVSPTSGQIFAQAAELLSELQTTLTTHFAGQGTVFGACRDEINATVADYAASDSTVTSTMRTLDANSEAGLADGRYPDDGLADQTLGTTVPVGSDPAALLTTPTSTIVNSTFDLDPLSAASWIANIIEWCSGYNFIEERSKTFGGDWEGFDKASSAIWHLSQFTEAQSNEMAASTPSARSEGSGSAASAAETYFTGLRDKLLVASDAIAAASSDMREFADAMAGAVATYEATINLCIDTVLGAAFALAAAGIFAATGVGAIVTGSVAGAAVVAIIAAAAAAWEVLMAVGDIVNLLRFGVGFLTTADGASLSLTTPAAYDNLLV